MAKKSDSKNPQTNEAAAEATPVAAGTTPIDVTVPVEGAAATAVAGETKPVSKRDSIPEHLRKGNRVCASCLISEADFLAKNPRYSLCQGVDVLCYRKGDRVIYGATLEDVQAKYPDKVGKVDDFQRPLISHVEGTGIKPGILVRGAIRYSRKQTDTGLVPPNPVSMPVAVAESAPTSSTAAGEGVAEAAGTTSAG